MNDATIRLTFTLALLAGFYLLERMIPARESVLNARRFGRHAALALFGALVARLALAGGLASVATIAQNNNIGLFNLIELPQWLAFVLAFLLLDFAIWAQHLVLHRLPWLWRLHRVHHCDTAMDVSTAFRFHPVEIFASLAFKVALVLLLGAPAGAVIAFEIVLGAGALFTHANLAIPQRLEPVLRLALITPALHVIHHSPNPIETNSNYGFSFNFWDRLFGTYRPVRLEQDGDIGLEDWRANNDQTLPAMLANPFK
jgi:sterol desaturase/sphingolipid hydroxylase (fatty acid hydroxylase superfamily)